MREMLLILFYTIQVLEMHFHLKHKGINSGLNLFVSGICRNVVLSLGRDGRQGERVNILFQQLSDSILPTRESSTLLGTRTEQIIIIFLFGKERKQRKEKRVGV